MSYMLEHAFGELDIAQTYIRPAYYLSNWLPYLDTAKETGVLPTFFPVSFTISMISPLDVADFTAEVLVDKTKINKVFELYGPAEYSSIDVAQAFSDVLDLEVRAEQIPRENWHSTLAGLKFSDDGIRNFIEMTEAVITGKVGPEGINIDARRGDTTLQDYVKHAIMV